MNTKVILAVFCAFQVVAGQTNDIPIVTQTLNTLGDLLNSITNAAQVLADAAGSELLKLGQDVIADVQAEFAKIEDLPATAQDCLSNAENEVQSLIDSETKKLTPLVLKEAIYILPVVGTVNTTINKVKSAVSTAEAAFTACATKGVVLQVLCDAEVVADTTVKVTDIVPEVEDEVDRVGTAVKVVQTEIQPSLDTLIKDATITLESIVPNALQCLVS